MASTSAAVGPHPSASLYVGDLVLDVTEAQLFEIFNAVGPVASVRVCRDAATRRSLGYAYVNFHHVEDAERALDTMNFKMIRQRPCRIMWSHRDPSLRKSGIGNIFVKNLAKSIDNKTLYDTFSMFGNILSCKVAENSKQESLGYGFVHYESEEAARNAIDKVNGKVIAGQKVSVSAFRSKMERGGGTKQSFTNVFVKNLPEDVDKEALDAKFGQFGQITSSIVVLDKETRKSRKFGFVNFGAPDQAAAAVEGLHNQTWDGQDDGSKPLHVCRAQKRAERDQELKDRFEQLKRQRQRQYVGINLYVKNLSDDITDESLTREFSKFGQITSAKVMLDHQLKSRGFGFVCFSTQEEATKAVTEMNGHMLDGKPLFVALAQRKDVRRAQLEAQHAARAKLGVGVPQPQMYPPGQPIFYQPAMAGMQRNYPQMGYPQMVPRPQFRQPAGQMMQVRQPNTQFGLVPAVSTRGPQAGAPPQQRNQRGGRGRQQLIPKQNQQPANIIPNRVQRQPQQQQGIKFSEHARNQQRQQVPQQAAPQQQPIADDAADAGIQLTIQKLAAAPEEQKKQMIGEHLFPLVRAQKKELAGKITGMLLEMDNGELIHLLESRDALTDKINEAMRVLEAHGAPAQ